MCRVLLRWCAAVKTKLLLVSRGSWTTLEPEMPRSVLVNQLTHIPRCVYTTRKRESASGKEKEIKIVKGKETERGEGSCEKRMQQQPYKATAVTQGTLSILIPCSKVASHNCYNSGSLALLSFVQQNILFVFFNFLFRRIFSPAYSFLLQQ